MSRTTCFLRVPSNTYGRYILVLQMHQSWLVLTKCSCWATRRIYAVTSKLYHGVQPVVLIRLIVARNTETIILRVQNYHMSMSRIWLGINAETILQQDTAPRKSSRAKFLLTVVVLQPSWPRWTVITYDKEFLLWCLINKTNTGNVTTANVKAAVSGDPVTILLWNHVPVNLKKIPVFCASLI